MFPALWSFLRLLAVTRESLMDVVEESFLFGHEDLPTLSSASPNVVIQTTTAGKTEPEGGWVQVNVHPGSGYLTFDQLREMWKKHKREDEEMFRREFMGEWIPQDDE